LGIHLVVQPRCISTRNICILCINSLTSTERNSFQIPAKPLCIETFFDYPTLGRFVIRDTKHTVGVGVCVNIPGREPPQTDDDKWAVGTVPFARRPQTTGGRSVTFSIPQPDDMFDKPSKNFSLYDEATFRTQSGKLETEL